MAPAKEAWLAWPVAASLWLGSTCGSTWLAVGTEAPGPLAALFPPWWTSREAFVAAAGVGTAVLRLGGLPTLLVVASDGGVTPARLRAAGALAVMRPQLAGLCSIGRE